MLQEGIKDSNSSFFPLSVISIGIVSLSGLYLIGERSVAKQGSGRTLPPSRFCKAWMRGQGNGLSWLLSVSRRYGI
ncbi:uncharacterized protein BO97DRAFT_449273 [Aspergillus homomorphus CBS 101889]|uniref:Uncharacterized protein n=1 Tax=Aspergillus homomorphus (strain CBS 101889) TaxID=1450537 RepID=A0A395I105_ASPHC|nr:hypothetical protein BO97DRAFT_449273 [Aspergillus homomorphus CBS 101889]RAL13882.1 hypothetical protein BO97DRAFT_449273 [Aspergillus homomorphus CBS 101889]